MIRFHGQPFRRKVRGSLTKNFYVRVYDPRTKQKRVITMGTSSKVAATKLLDAWRVQAAVGTLDLFGEDRSLPVKTAVARWLAHLSPRVVAVTLHEATAASERWCTTWRSKNVADVTRAEIQTYLNDRLTGKIGRRGPLKPATVNQDRAILKWFLRWCLREGVITRDPSDGVDKYRVPDRAVRSLSEDERAALLAAAEEKIRPLIGFAVETGLRRRTLLSLEWRHIDFVNGWLDVEGFFMKSRRDFQAPLSQEALRWLEVQRAAVSRIHPNAKIFPLRRTQAHRLFDLARKKAGLNGVRFHDLRKTFQNFHRRRGVSLEVLMRLMDHKDVRTALKDYRHIQRDELAKAVGGERENDAGSRKETGASPP